MQGGRGRGDPFFGMAGDRFAGFGGMPSLFGGRDPFDDPFFTNPMAGMLQPNPFGHMGSSLLGGSPFMGGSQFGSSLFGPSGSPFMDAHEPRGYEHRQSMPNTSRGLVIEKLNSDDENNEQQAGHDHHMHGGSARQPYVEQPYDGSGGRELMQPQYGNQFNVMHDTHSHPQTQSFTFQSSTVTYGGSNGVYYTASTTRWAGSDGVENLICLKQQQQQQQQTQSRLGRVWDMSKATSKQISASMFPTMIQSPSGDTFFLLSEPDSAGSPPRRAPPAVETNNGHRDRLNSEASVSGHAFGDNHGHRDRLNSEASVSGHAFGDNHSYAVPSSLKSAKKTDALSLGLPALRTGLSDDDLRESAYEVLLSSVAFSGIAINSLENPKKDKGSRFLSGLKNRRD